MKTTTLVTLAVVLSAGLSSSEAQATMCATCDVALEQCVANCSGLNDKLQRVQCLLGCDNAAARCSCDEGVTLRSEDLLSKSKLVRPETEAAACHSTTPCDSSYGSCASWSSYADCGDPFCGVHRLCGEDCEPGIPCPGPALKQNQERYRVCFNAAQQACTEYQRTFYLLSCGC